MTEISSLLPGLHLSEEEVFAWEWENLWENNRKITHGLVTFNEFALRQYIIDSKDICPHLKIFKSLWQKMSGAWLTNFYPMWGNSGYSGWSRLCFAVSILWGINRAGVSAGDWQAYLPPGDLWTLWDTFSLHILLTKSFLVKEVADLHDVSYDLHWACHSLLTGREVILHLFEVRRWSPALLILVPVK